jgi:hypothetical protein
VRRGNPVSGSVVLVNESPEKLPTADFGVLTGSLRGRLRRRGGGAHEDAEDAFELAAAEGSHVTYAVVPENWHADDP